MASTVVVLVNGEVLVNGQNMTIKSQRENALQLAEGLLPLFDSDTRVVVLHGNKPQVGFVLFRSELASHILHAIPLDVCGADTQGATGYMLSQAFINVLRRKQVRRQVMCVLTQTRVRLKPAGKPLLKAIGPWFDREKADQYRQTRGWTMIEEPGSGYRRAVPSLPAEEILEFDGIQQLVESGTVVIAAGGGGIPVIENGEADYEGFEAVLDTEEVAVLLASRLKAKLLISVVESDHKFTREGLRTEGKSHLDLNGLDDLLTREEFSSTSVKNKLNAASNFLHTGGEQVIITTLRKLNDTMQGNSGLTIGANRPATDFFEAKSQD
ncbi:MAG TPA: hypothetical protein PKD23_06175 [Bellilinea sp.]|nr:hypothetical protein [Bellilinea sp.]